MSSAPYKIKALLASAIFASFFLKLSNIALLNPQLVLPHHVKTICRPNVHVGTASHVHTLIEYEDLQKQSFKQTQDTKFDTNRFVHTETQGSMTALGWCE